MEKADLDLFAELQDIKTLKKLNEKLEANFASLPLATAATDLVHGEGKLDASVMMIGEAPGYHESVQRKPFVGRSGQLLRKVMLEVKLDPKTVFISNIVKVRPPENRDPKPDEITAYKPYLDREIELIEPKIIVTLGRFSMGKFLPDVKISQVHGRLHKIKWNEHELYILPMYHPAAALRATRVKNSFISDFEKINKILTWISEQEKTKEFKSELKEALF